MDPRQIVTRLVKEGRRGGGTDAERRAACGLRDHLRSQGRPARLETVWVHPDWALVHAGHGALAVLGSLLSVWLPGAGLAVLSLAATSLAGDLTGRLYLLRRLSPRRATQNVVSEPPEPPHPQGGPAVRVILTANLDSGRTGVAYGPSWVAGEARLRRALGGHLSSPLAVLTGALLLLIVLAGARVAGGSGPGLGAVQLAPTVAALLAFALLSDIALSEPSPGAGVNASGVASALALTAALDAAPLRRLEVELVLAGAGDGFALGMQEFVRSRRQRRAEETIVLSLEPCASGTPQWLTRDGQLLGLRYHPRLTALASQAAEQEAHLDARPYASHGRAGAYPARLLGWPAIAIGCRDQLGRVARAHTEDDVPEHVQDSAMRAVLELSLALLRGLDDDLELTHAAMDDDR